MALLSCENIKKSFEGTEVLKDISISVNEGEILSVIGPSGSGKSTFLRCATGLERIDGGRIVYNNMVYADTKDGNVVYADKADALKIKVLFGLVFQNFNLFPHMSVMENIMDAPVRVQKRDKKEVKEEAEALLVKMGLTDRKDAYPCELSGGQCQRVAIARALALEPDIMLFDEPTSALDPELTREVLDTIRELASEGTTMLVVTHEMSFAREVAGRVLFMEDGRIVEQGTPMQIFDAPEQERTREFLRRAK